MIARAAGGENQPFGTPKLLRVQIQTAEVRTRVIVDQAAAHSVFQRLGLLVDLLEHVVLEGALVGFASVEVDIFNTRFDLRAVGIQYLVFILGQHANLAILQEDGAFGVALEDARVARKEILPLTNAEDQRAAQPGADDEAGILGTHRVEPISSLQHFERLANGFDKIAVKLMGDELGHDFRVGVRPEYNSLLLKV